jgi:DGQHR domain-containing protein
MAPLVHRYTASLVTQGRHRFYTLTVPSDVLAKTCFVIRRDEDPQDGFQRLLDLKRAKQIADYIDTGLGTIPNSIVLSAQPEAEFRYDRGRKTVEFSDNPKCFLILDGQHRVFGFSLAKSELRVPVVIYNELSRKDESRLFIDINTKQRPVPNELLLDIRKLANYQDDVETTLGEVFDLFNEMPGSPLSGLLSPTKKRKGYISRVTFNTALKPLLDLFEDSDSEYLYNVLAAYISAVHRGLSERSLASKITDPVIFRAFTLLFRDVARTVKDRFGQKYSVDNFSVVLKPLFKNVKGTMFKAPGNSVTVMYKQLADALKAKFTL